MKRKTCVVVLGLFIALAVYARPRIMIPVGASAAERLGVRELRRYIYLRCGELLPIETRSSWRGWDGDEAIVVAQKGSPILGHFGDIAWDTAVNRLSEGQYLLKTFREGKRTRVAIIGGDGIGCLYGVYHFLEKMGVRFYLEGDVVPDGTVPLVLPDLSETGAPLFRLRGVQPFHDFPEGPDWWNRDDYLALLSQLPKLRMNFFGLHTYPEGRPNAEPTVWIGLEKDQRPDGRVVFAYPSSYQNTLRGNWGYKARKTSSFHFGADRLFERDDFGCDAMTGMSPEPKNPADSITLFNRVGMIFKDVFGYARSLGIKTCVGTETPLIVPQLVQQKIKENGRDPRSPEMIKELYRGIFSRIMKAYPVDYYWFWTGEEWTWSDASPDATQAVVSDLEMAIRAARETKAPFSLATCGWVLGPPSNRTLFDTFLPKEVALSCINREVGKAPLDLAFTRIRNRSKWAIPWLEDDPSLTSPQLWAGRMRRDAADALRYGCDGLLGIHWRTRILSPNVLALARAAWEQEPWNNLPSSPEPEEGPLNGRFVSVPDQTIAETKEPSVYQDVRDRVFGYRFLLPDGTYAVTLKFCETQFDRKDARVFDIRIQNQKVVERLDIFERAGRFKALDITIPQITVSNGRLAIDFADRIHYPSIAGIVISSPTYTKKINCGGPRTLDYEADWPETPRFLDVDDFYRDWSANQFGSEAAGDIAALFVRLDGRLPIAVNWVNGPGGLNPDNRPWDVVQHEYNFVNDMAEFQPRIRGIGNRDRFDYWLNQFSYMRDVAHLACLWGEFNRFRDSLLPVPDPILKARLTQENLLPLRRKMIQALGEIFSHILSSVSNSGELGTIANWEQHILPDVIETTGLELEKLLGRKLPVDAQPTRAFSGPCRLIVPTVRTSLRAGESWRLKAMVLAKQDPKEVLLRWRSLGTGSFRAVPLRKLGRGVYEAVLPSPGDDFEYYLTARADDRDLLFPATAPNRNQSVVVIR